MTSDRPSSLADDIAHVRRMVDEGRDAPLLNGPFLIAAGVIFGAANLAQWAVQTGVLTVEPIVQLWVWLAAGAVFAVALTVLARRAARKPGHGSPANRAVGAAWSGLGFGIFVMWLSFMAVGFSSGDWTMMWAMPSVVAVAYGSAWIVAGAVSGQRWMTGVGVFAYAGAVLFGALIGNPAVYLAFTVFMVVTALAPGLVLTRREPADVA